MATINYQIAILNDTADALQTINPILALGQVGVEIGTRLFKIGDGVKGWNELNYAVLNDGQSAWVGVSQQPDNRLTRSEVDGGIYSPPLTEINNLAAYQSGKNDNTTVNYSETSESNLDSEVKKVAKRTGWLLNKIITALGPQFQPLQSMQMPLDNGSPLTINAVISAMIEAAIADLPADQFGAQINDNATNTNNVWSSQNTQNKIDSSVSAAIQELIGTAPDALDTLYELADAVAANGDVLGGLAAEMSTVVRFVEQTLTAPEQAIARDNIGAASAATTGALSEGEPNLGDQDTVLMALLIQNMNMSYTDAGWVSPPLC